MTQMCAYDDRKYITNGIFNFVTYIPEVYDNFKNVLLQSEYSNVISNLFCCKTVNIGM